MAVETRVWTAEEPLSDLTMFGDWDYMASMVSSLRIHLFEHGTIPTWNFLFCGGRPELAVPSSWAWTWPSLFAYTLPPNAALLTLWLSMTVIGILAMRSLLLRWVGSPFAAITGACLYALNGYFGRRFFAGHVSWAFFHLIPVLLLVYERAFEKEIAGPRRSGPPAALLAVSFLFFSAALPHGLFHAYPIFLLLVAFRLATAWREAGWRRSLGASATLLLVHVLGASLAAYKLWPAVRWQFGYPRQNVFLESYSLRQVIGNTLEFVTDFPPVFLQVWHRHLSIVSDAYIGPGPWLAAGAALVAEAWWRRRGARREGPSGGPHAPDPIARGIPWFGLVLVAAGLSLSLGNDHPWGPGSLFRHLPLLSGVRAMGRYQILTVFGVSVLVATGLARLCRLRGGNLPLGLAPALFLAICAPAAAQAFVLAWNVRATPNRQIERQYPVRLPHAPPEFVGAQPGPMLATDHVTVLLSKGWWIANCMEDLTLPEPRVALYVGHRAPISSPPPEALARLTRDSLTLAYPRGLRGDVLVHLPTLPTFRYSPAPRAFILNRPVFRGEDVRGGELTIRGLYAGPREGALASLVALALTPVFFAWRRVRGRRA